MDELEDLFNSALKEKDQSKNTDFEGLYKNWGRPGSQEERRRSLLDNQKSQRNDQLDQFRGIVALVDAVEEVMDWNSYNQTRIRYRPTIYVAGFHRASPTYRDVLMMSEWLIDRPQDFAEKWFLVPCPKGTRVLIVAYRGITKLYTKYGQFLYQFRSALPGGNPFDGKRGKKLCVLDGFWCRNNNTLYILDLLAWNNQQMTDCETEFRNYWLIQQLSNFASCQVINKRNQVIMLLLPKVPCDTKSINEFMDKHPVFINDSPTLDGLLFYHKEAHYIGGTTPLVGWLFPYMLTEILGEDVKVNEKFLESIPVDYVDQAEFILKFEQKHAKKTQKMSRRNSTSSSQRSVSESMEAENTTPNTIEQPVQMGESTTKEPVSTSENPQTTDVMEATPAPTTETMEETHVPTSESTEPTIESANKSTKNNKKEKPRVDSPSETMNLLPAGLSALL